MMYRLYKTDVGTSTVVISNGTMSLHNNNNTYNYVLTVYNIVYNIMTLSQMNRIIIIVTRFISKICITVKHSLANRLLQCQSTRS